jgi:LacI family transcriptional regulator
MREVAQRAGVSLGTVSNVLNNPERVAASTRDRVTQAIEELGFVRNASASQLRGGASRVVGLVVLDMTNPFFMEMARGVEDAAREEGLIVILCNSDASSERESTYLGLLREQRVAGVLINPTRKGHGGKPIEELRGLGTPVVLLDRVAQHGELCSVAVDDVHGGQLAAEHLIGLGYPTIALVNGPSTIQQCADRRRGFLRAITKAGIEVELVDLEMAAMNIQAGELAATPLLEAAGRRPIAAFCANDVLAVGRLRGCLAAGLRVPEDVAIVGYDDIVYAASATVALTSVRQPAYEIGQAAMRLLLAEMHAERTGEPHEHETVLFKPELVVRKSTSGTHEASGADGAPGGELIELRATSFAANAAPQRRQP